MNEQYDVSYDNPILEDLRSSAQEMVGANTMEILKPYL